MFDKFRTYCFLQKNNIMYICTQNNSSPILFELYKRKVIHANLPVFLYLFHYICPALIKLILSMLYLPPIPYLSQKPLFILPPSFPILLFRVYWSDGMSPHNTDVLIQQKNETKKNLISLNDFLDLMVDELISNSPKIS